MIYYDSRRNRVELDAELDRGGEAAIFKVRGRKDLVAKIYFKPLRGNYGLKLSWMQQNPPKDPGRELGFASIAWPLELLYNPNRQLSGYLMPFMSGTVKLINVISPMLRVKTLPGFNWKYLHRTARNLAASVKALHERDYVIGDVNESNILVSPSAMITLIDTDSFQVHTNDRTQIFHCPVGKPEYTPPELQGIDFSSRPRSAASDYFGLAVLIFQLLLEGNHPFRGKFTGMGDPPVVVEKIQRGWFPYAHTPGPILPPPNAPGLDILLPELQKLILRCFVDGHKNPSRRPTPEMWIAALEKAESLLVLCEKGHYYLGNLPACPWCARQAALSHARRTPKPSGTPRLTVRHALTNFGLMVYGESAQRTIVLSNSGLGELKGSIQSDSAWLSAIPKQFKLKSGEAIQVTLIAEAGKLIKPASTTSYTGLLSIKTNGGAQQIQASMRVGVPQLGLNTKLVDFGDMVEGDVLFKNIQISNPGSASLSGSITVRSPWLSVTPASFTCFPGSDIAIILRADSDQAHDVSVDGSCSIPLFINSNGGFGTVRVQLRLVMAKLAVQRKEIEFPTILQGDQAVQEMTITNSGAGELRGTIACKDKWLEAVPAAFQTASGKSVSIQLTMNSKALSGSPRGTPFQTEVSIQSNGGDQQIVVSGLVGAPEMRIDQCYLNFGNVVKGDIQRADLEIANQGLGILKGVVTSHQPWIYAASINFSCAAGAKTIIPVFLNTGAPGCPVGREAKAAIEVKSDGGNQAVESRFLVEAPRLKVIFRDDEMHSINRRGRAASRFIICNLGRAQLAAAIVSNVPWLEVEPDTLSISTNEMESIYVAVDRSRLVFEDDRAEGTVLIQSNGGIQQIALQAQRQTASVNIVRHEYLVELAPDVVMVLENIPAGDFTIGCPAGRFPDIPRDEMLQTHLYLNEFWLGLYPITNGQYRAFLRAAGYQPPNYWENGQIPAGKEDHPVVCVTWNDAQAFCRWVSDISGLSIRLPTEAEWEKAVRGPDSFPAGYSQVYPWGEDVPDKTRCNFEGADTSPVGQYGFAGISPYGCADMCGNVWEWTSSLSKPYPYQASDGREDANEAGSRILRGGSWFSHANQLRATYRLRGNVNQANSSIGFRCAMTI